MSQSRYIYLTRVSLPEFVVSLMLDRMTRLSVAVGGVVIPGCSANLVRCILHGIIGAIPSNSNLLLVCVCCLLYLSDMHAEINCFIFNFKITVEHWSLSENRLIVICMLWFHLMYVPFITHQLFWVLLSGLVFCPFKFGSTENSSWGAHLTF